MGIGVVGKGEEVGAVQCSAVPCKRFPSLLSSVQYLGTGLYCTAMNE